ncbi:hypothetical protein [Salinisphaera sp. G21_0]|uniref:hypothetical protein n=1 Tax=Salinisphaera sp. G21_0 TaxID=2821094 RepID=UPI001ADCC495|nr:hypothetical protein [Salinisphaera sp. G21_0]MBO9484356.1 hypothetical protein [Salinisphaera sp. G21_0]
MIAQKIEHYEYQTDPVLSQWDQQAGAIALIKELMRQHGLTQAELPEIGSQGVVSEVLNDVSSMQEKTREPQWFNYLSVAIHR